jgi:hypothetical protein
LVGGSTSKEKIQELKRLKIEPWKTVTVGAHKGAWRLKMETWRVCRPVVADSHHFDEQDPDLDPQLSEK